MDSARQLTPRAAFCANEQGSKRRRLLSLWAVLLLILLLVGLFWGLFLDEQAYSALRRAAILLDGAARESERPLEASPLRSPLYVGVLALLAWIGCPLAWTGLLISLLGWSVAMVICVRFLPCRLQTLKT